MVSVATTLALALPTPEASTQNNLVLEALDALEASAFHVSIPLTNVYLTLAALDAIETTAITVNVVTDLMSLNANDARDKAAFELISEPFALPTGPEYPPAPGPAPINDVLIGESPIGEVPVFDPWTVVLSQYANSPITTKLVTSWTAAIDPTYNLQAFFDSIWNIGQGVNGYGLDVWGRIVGLPNGRVIAVDQGTYFGFAEAQPSQGFISTWNCGFNQGFFSGGCFYNGEPFTTNFTLADDPFLLLIMAKAATNITNGSIPAVNQILLNLFPNRGNCYVQESFPFFEFFGFAEALEGLGGVFGFNQSQFYNGQDLGLQMQITYTFDFPLTPIELGIVEHSGALPTPAGVQALVVQNF